MIRSKRTVILPVSLFVLLSFVARAVFSNPAASQGPVQLPTDPALAADIRVTGQFRSLVNGLEQPLNLRVWAAAFHPNEPFDFALLMDRYFLELDLPEGAGWELFEPAGEQLSVTFNVTDTQNRLVSVKLYKISTGALVGTLYSQPGGGSVTGTLNFESDVRDYKAVIFTANSGVLANLAVDMGKFDKVVPFTIPGSFKPFRPGTIPCAHNLGGDGVDGPVGNPRTAAGTMTSTTGLQSSQGCALKDFTNENSTTQSVIPPGDYATFIKRGWIHNTASAGLGILRVGDPADLASVQAIIAAALQQDTALAMGNVSAPPYSTGAGHWHAAFQGQAVAVMAVPYEKKRKGGLVSILVGAIVTAITPETNFLSILARTAGNTLLQNLEQQQQTGFKPGDVFAVGDVYTLGVVEQARDMSHLAGILQDVTFTLQPNIAPPTGSGGGAIELIAATTTPSPPAPNFDTQLTFSSPSWAVTRAVPKGYKYKATGNVTTPLGYQGGTSPDFFVPGSTNVNVPCTLTKLLELKVKTTGPGGINASAQVKVKQGATVVYEGPSALQTDGTYSISFYTVSPGAYQVTATGGAPPAEGTAVSINVVPAVIQNVTASYGSGGGPPPPPPP